MSSVLVASTGRHRVRARYTDARQQARVTAAVVGAILLAVILCLLAAAFAGPAAAVTGPRYLAVDEPGAVAYEYVADLSNGGPRYLAVDAPGAVAYEYMADLSNGIGRRIVGTGNERRAARYIADSLTALGYSPVVDAFPTKNGSRAITSRNVIATKPGASNKTIVIGAHYDSVDVGRGAFDNATGVGLLLALAKELQAEATPYTIEFVAFGGEEGGHRGSRHYWRSLTADEKAGVSLMINFDSVATGDQLCVYSGPGAKAWPHLQLQKLARGMGITLLTNPGLNKDYPYGTTGDWSDHEVFQKAGVPFAYFEATNWLIGEKDGELNTARDGAIWHTKKDTVSYIELRYPGRMEMQLQDSAVVLLEFLTQPIPGI